MLDSCRIGCLHAFNCLFVCWNIWEIWELTGRQHIFISQLGPGVGFVSDWLPSRFQLFVCLLKYLRNLRANRQTAYFHQSAWPWCRIRVGLVAFTLSIFSFFFFFVCLLACLLCFVLALVSDSGRIGCLHAFNCRNRASHHGGFIVPLSFVLTLPV